MRFYFLTLSAAVVALSAAAAPLLPDEALNRAVNSVPMRKAAKSARYELVKTEKCGDMDALYVFGNNAGAGFVIASADDCAPALLGYGDAPLCDARGEMAPALQTWLSNMARQIEFSAANPSEKKTHRIAREQKAPIAPLCQTLWSQDAPYNNLCPLYKDNRTVTGCVATAISQVMKYHNWPEQGEGSVSYSWNGQKLSQDFSTVTFDWAYMLNTYDAASSPESQLAVATLMQCVGYALEMNYSVEASDAQATNIGPVLGKYFRYDKSMQYLMRDYYTLNDWEDIIYNSLSKYGPVIYDAQAGIGGHSFVCDGYEGDGYFHFNWGWAGLSDGYFILDALDPASQGIGGANGGFNFMQDVIVGITPDMTGDSEWSFIMYGDRTCVYGLDTSMNVFSLKSAFNNFGPGTIQNAWAGLEFKNIDDPEAEPVYDLSNYRAFKIGAGVGGFGIPIPDLPDGRYSVSAVYRSGNSDDAEIHYVLWPLYGQGSCIFTVNNGTYSLETFGSKAPDFINGEIPEKIHKDTPLNIKGTLVNPNDAPYLCYLSGMLYDRDMYELVSFSAPVPIEMEALESVSLDLDVNIIGIAGLPDGYYNLVLAQLVMQNSYITDLSNPYRVYVTSVSGIDKVFENAAEGELEFFSVDGVKVGQGNGHDLAPGLYVVRSSAGSKMVLIR